MDSNGSVMNGPTSYEIHKNGFGSCVQYYNKYRFIDIKSKKQINDFTKKSNFSTNEHKNSLVGPRWFKLICLSDPISSFGFADPRDRVSKDIYRLETQILSMFKNVKISSRNFS